LLGFEKGSIVDEGVVVGADVEGVCVGVEVDALACALSVVDSVVGVSGSCDEAVELIRRGDDDCLFGVLIVIVGRDSAEFGE